MSLITINIKVAVYRKLLLAVDDPCTPELLDALCAQEKHSFAHDPELYLDELFVGSEPRIVIERVSAHERKADA